MRKFFESLENRTLLSAATAATLLADHQLILTDAAAIKSDLAALVKANKTDDAAIVADIKGTAPATNRKLLAIFKADVARNEAALTHAVAVLVARSDALAAKSVIAGNVLLNRWTAARQAIVTDDIAALGTVCTTPLAALQADLASPTVAGALSNLANANPSISSLSSAIATQENDTTTLGAAIGTAATTFQGKIATLAGDVGAVAAAPPSVVGTYVGRARITAGDKAGQSSKLSWDITGEDANGVFTGVNTVTNSSGTEEDPMTGTVTATGAFSAVSTDTANGNVATLTGIVNGKTIKGTYSTPDASGTFSVTLT